MNQILSTQIKDDLSIVLCGEAGQGIQTIEYVLTRLLKDSGYNVFAIKEYMSRIRRGSNCPSQKIFDKARKEGDETTESLFKDILADEEGHHDTFTSLLEEV